MVGGKDGGRLGEGGEISFSSFVGGGGGDGEELQLRLLFGGVESVPAPTKPSSSFLVSLSSFPPSSPQGRGHPASDAAAGRRLAEESSLVVTIKHFHPEVEGGKADAKGGPQPPGVDEGEDDVVFGPGAGDEEDLFGWVSGWVGRRRFG